MQKWREIVFIVSLSVVTTLLIVGVVGYAGIRWSLSHPEALEKYAAHYLPKDPGGTSRELFHTPDRTVVETVREANPAVVAITVSKEMPKYEQYLRQYESPFGGFFNFQIPDVRQNGTEKREIGGGSGFLVSSDGYIVTNRHVVSDEEAEYAVFLNDGTKYDGRVIARDPVLDIAIVKIEGDELPHLAMGDSNAIEVGETVIAIGNALAEYRNTVSVGVVSGLARSIVAGDGQGSAEALDQLIQTDAAINPGNSGGPLLNLRGEVIGVNVAVASGAENIGFALPMSSVRNVVDSVRETGKIVRPFIGVRYIPLTKELQKKNNLSVDYGVLVQRGEGAGDLAVMPGSPADKAGIVENDIILEFDGQKLTEKTQLATLIRAKKVGDTVTMKVLHRGEEKLVTLTLEEMK